MNLAKLFSLDSLWRALLAKSSFPDVLRSIVNAIGLTDVFGFLAQLAIGQYEKSGRGALIRAVTIKESSLQAWGTKIYGSNNGAAIDDIVAKQRALASAFVDFVESLVPALRRKP